MSTTNRITRNIMTAAARLREKARVYRKPSELFLRWQDPDEDVERLIAEDKVWFEQTQSKFANDREKKKRSRRTRESTHQ